MIKSCYVTPEGLSERKIQIQEALITILYFNCIHGELHTSHKNMAFGLNSPCFTETTRSTSVYGNGVQFRQIYYIANKHFNHVSTVRLFKEI